MEKSWNVLLGQKILTQIYEIGISTKLWNGICFENDKQEVVSFFGYISDYQAFRRKVFIETFSSVILKSLLLLGNPKNLRFLNDALKVSKFGSKNYDGVYLSAWCSMPNVDSITNAIMFRNVLKEVSNQGYRKILVDVAAGNSRIIEFYLNQKFYIVKAQTRLILLQKDLQND